VTAPPRLDATLRAFADRLFVTGGRDPGNAAIAIPPARLAIYRELLRGNYRGMLRFALTYSFALMDRELAAASGADGLPEDTGAIVVRFLEVSPSRTHSSREIADRFMAFLPREFPKLVARRPDLADLMTLERAELGAIFATDDPGRCLDPAEIDALAAGSLDDLLALTVVRAPSASLLRLSHAVVELRAALEREETPSPPIAVEERAAVSRGRPPRFGIEFGVFPEEAALVLESAEPGVPIAAERLAASWFAALPEPARSRDDQWKAGTFAGAVLQALRTGFLRAN
jgi:hypothetical protein